MRSLRLVSLVIVAITSAISPGLFITSLLAQSNPPTNQADQSKIRDSYGNLPLSFEANQGQANSQVKFLTHSGAYSLFLTGDEAVLAFHAAKDKNAFAVATRLATSPADTIPTLNQATESILRMKLRHANANARVTGVDELEGKSNYFLGNDPAKWRTNIPTYSRVKYEAVYPGIDLVYYGNQRQLEYDFIVAPGADPRSIAFEISGASRIRKDAKGDLLFKIQEGEIRWHKPVVYQEKDGARQEIAASYSITDKNRVGFELAQYDATRSLYIDPLIYSTYLGGSGDDYGQGIALDSVGNVYVTGYTSSTNFPTKNPFQAANGSSVAAFVTKINAAGTALIYSTYLGGSGVNSGSGIAVDGAGNAYVTGGTNSADFPTKNALQPSYSGGGDAFVAKISALGSALVYSTFLGGSASDGGTGIAVSASGNAYVIGETTSANFPTTPGAFQTTCGCSDVFVSKLSASGSALAYSTFLGGSGQERAGGIAVDHLGNAYVTGSTISTDFPTKNALQPANAGDWDAFVTKFNPSGSALIYSTYLGDPQTDFGNAIAADSSGNAYVTGTNYTNFCNHITCAYYMYLYKFNFDGSAIVYRAGINATYTAGNGIAVDSSNNAFLIGMIGGDTIGPLYRAFVARFDASGSQIGSTTYLSGGGQTYGYGIATDGNNDAYVTGATRSVKFPTKNPLQAANAGGFDVFVSKIDLREATTTTLSSSPNPSTYGQPVTFTATVSSSLGAPPDGETVTFMKGKTILGTGTLSGGSASFTTSTLPVATNAITAVYAGDSNFGPSKSNTVTQVVNKAATRTTLTSSLNPSNSGQSVSFTASISPQFGGKVTGNVTFYDGTTALKTVSVSSNAAKFTTSTLTAGSHTITATYNGSTSFTGSSGSLTQTVH